MFNNLTFYGVNITTILLIILVIFLGGKILSKVLKILIIVGLVLILLGFNFGDEIANIPSIIGNFIH